MASYALPMAHKHLKWDKILRFMVISSKILGTFVIV